MQENELLTTTFTPLFETPLDGSFYTTDKIFVTAYAPAAGALFNGPVSAIRRCLLPVRLQLLFRT